MAPHGQAPPKAVRAVDAERPVEPDPARRFVYDLRANLAECMRSLMSTRELLAALGNRLRRTDRESR
jgi:hypothetical protein